MSDTGMPVSLKPLKVEKPIKLKAWHPKGMVTKKSYERLLLKVGFQKVQ